MTDTQDRKTKEIWVSGTEEPDWPGPDYVAHATDEGAQKMKLHETGDRLIEQLGIRIIDDVLYEEEEIDEDDRMIINMGPQHPSTHGVLRLQVELEGEIVRRIKPIIGYLHTGMEKTAETLTFMQDRKSVV